MLLVILAQSPAGSKGPKWTAIRSDFPGIAGVGSTQEEAQDDLRGALGGVIADAAESGWSGIPSVDAPHTVKVVDQAGFTAFVTPAIPASAGTASIGLATARK